MSDDTTLDMLELARFAVLPGAARLVRAFSGIPEGALRESTIHHAEIMAATYAGAPAHQRMPDPIGSFAPQPVPKLKLASRTGQEPKTSTPEMDIVKMRMSGLTAAQINAKTGLPLSRIYDTLKAARAAGVSIPRGAPLRGKGSTGRLKWYTSVDEIPVQGFRQIQKAAALRGITVEAYIERRQVSLKMAQEGASYERILEATGERDAKSVSAWLSIARGAGFHVPYVTFLKTPPKAWDTPEPDAEPEPEVIPDAVHAPIGRVFPDASTLPLGTRLIVQKAAARRGMTVEAYQELRESVVQHRMNGKTPHEIAVMTGEVRFFVRDILDAAKARGVTFPELSVEDVDARPSQKAAG